MWWVWFHLKNVKQRVGILWASTCGVMNRCFCSNGKILIYWDKSRAAEWINERNSMERNRYVFMSSAECLLAHTNIIFSFSVLFVSPSQHVIPKNRLKYCNYIYIFFLFSFFIGLCVECSLWTIYEYKDIYFYLCSLKGRSFSCFFLFLLWLRSF